MDIIKEVEGLVEKLFDETFSIKLDGYIDTNVSMNDLGYYFVWDKRSKRKLGCCRYNLKQINLSTLYVMNNYRTNPHLIEDTIRHEIAHAISHYMDKVNGTGHGEMWKRVAVQVGAKPNRCKRGIVSAKSKWTLVCPNSECDVKGDYHRKPKTNKACGKCCDKYSNGKFDSKFRYNLIQNY